MTSNRTSELSPGWIKQILGSYSISADEQLCTMIQHYIALLLRWNTKMSLTAITAPEEIVRIHFAESILAGSEAGIDKGRLADIGTGAGFPGIPIRMVRPEIALTLIEANVKKCAFLGEVVRILSLQGVSIIRSRMEKIADSEMGLFDFLTSRAVGNYPAILSWAHAHLVSNGSIVLFVGAEDAELLADTPGWYWNPPTKIQESRSRFLLKGTKQ